MKKILSIIGILAITMPCYAKDLSARISDKELTMVAVTINEGEDNEYIEYQCKDGDELVDKFRVDDLNSEKTSLTALADVEENAGNKTAINRRIAEIDALLALAE